MAEHDKGLLYSKHSRSQRSSCSQVDRASAGLPNQTHEAACPDYAPRCNLPPAIEGCACGCKEFNEVKK